jgi:hypothetical protein
MAKEPQEEGGTVPEACKTAIHLHPSVAGVRRSRIPEMWFDVAMAPLLRVQIRRIGWQPFHLKLWMCRDILLDDHGPMRAHSVPDADHRCSDVPLEVAEGQQAISPTNGMLNMALVNLAGPRQGNDRRELPTFAHAPEDGRVPPRSPRGGRLGANRKAGLIAEDAFRASAASLFLMRGQSRVSQAWTRASSRSRA